MGSPLSYQLPPIDINFSILSSLGNLPASNNISTELVFPDCLPLSILNWNYDIFEKASTDKVLFLQKLKVTHTECQSIEKETRKQRDSKQWHEYRKNRLTSTSAHKTFIKKKNFDTLCTQLHKPFNDQIESVKKALNHGIKNEAVALEKYKFIMNYRLHRSTKIKEAGLIIQSHIFWLGASPNEIILDKNTQEIGLIEIKCPYSKRNYSVSVMVNDKSFYIALDKEKKPYLKKDHQYGYFTQIQVATGLAGLKWCHFVVYVYEGIVIVKVEFDKEYFNSVIEKMNTFYKDYYLDNLLHKST